ncbi:hypothetical protein GCM10022394_11580 [Zobellella aerophila]|uniref:Uncharacterized protein n=1 Tax=Zobellella aerophila TaxID=870480 RepID=A0ABP6VEU6_9GAMM
MSFVIFRKYFSIWRACCDPDISDAVPNDNAHLKEQFNEGGAAAACRGLGHGAE